MVKQRADELSIYLKHRAGENLRTVVRYTETEFSLAYLRDDISEPRFLQRMEEVLLNISKGGPNRNENLAEQFGPLRASVHVREGGVFLHFPVAQDEGIIVSLEPGAAQQLSSFIRECMNRI